MSNSRNDNFLSSFGQEYQKLLSHRRTVGDVNPEQLRDALFQKRMKPEKYDTYDEKVRRYADEILVNMQRRFGYSKESASTPSLRAEEAHHRLRRDHQLKSDRSGAG